jgi:hypothetical protein
VAEGVVIRPERDADHPVIAELVRAAFVGHPDEVASFVERIRASEQFIPELALVAEDSSGLIAHVMLSWVGVEGGSRTRILNLTPMSVRPDRQRIGVGARLPGRARPRPRSRRRSPTTLSWSSGSRDTAPTSPVGSSIRPRSTLSGTSDRSEKRGALGGSQPA